MATFDYTHYYKVEIIGGQYTITEVYEAGSYTLTDTAEPLSPGDILSESTLGAGFMYMGYSASDASLLTIKGGVWYLFTNTSDYTVDETVTISGGDYPYCLLAGTLVATPSGQRPVEDIRPGDEVLTADGQAVAVRWVGRQSLITLFAGNTGLPVVIRAGALGDNVPTADLCVSGDHAIAIDGYLVCAAALINGTTITRMPNPPAQLDYYHLELDAHRIILANGTPVESFIDDVTRRGFDNYSEWVDLGLEPLPTQALDHPRIKSPRQLASAVGGVGTARCEG